MKKKNGFKDQRGQGMTEYILIVALIAVAVIGAVKFFGSRTREGFKDSANAIDKAVQGGISSGSGK